jgi:hypothetical protein
VCSSDLVDLNEPAQRDKSLREAAEAADGFKRYIEANLGQG